MVGNVVDDSVETSLWSEQGEIIMTLRIKSTRTKHPRNLFTARKEFNSPYRVDADITRWKFTFLSFRMRTKVNRCNRKSLLIFEFRNLFSNGGWKTRVDVH